MDGTRLLVLFEAARADSLRAVGLPYSEMLARGLNALTIEARLRNHACAQVDDLLLVEVKATDVGRLRFSFGYEVRRERDDMLVATGETVHICRDSGSGQPSRVPDWLRDALNQLRGRGPADAEEHLASTSQQTT